MTGKQILSSYPLVVKRWKEWSKTNEFAVENAELGMMPDQMLEIVLDYNMRALYDFFDDQDLIVEISLLKEYDVLSQLVTEKSFNAHIGHDIVEVIDGVNEAVDGEDSYFGEFFPTRAEAERDGFLKAFEILEKRLKDEDTFKL